MVKKTEKTLKDNATLELVWNCGKFTAFGPFEMSNFFSQISSDLSSLYASDKRKTQAEIQQIDLTKYIEKT